MKFTPTRLAGVQVIEPRVFEDDRGYFMDTWQQEKFREAGIEATFVQHSVSQSSEGALRGLHYQLTQPQGKLVRAIRGEVFDVAVDLRRSSASFGQWVGETLSESNRRQIWIPPGFAHGFLVISPVAELDYRLTGFYAPDDERTVRWDDPDIGIDWPISDGQVPVLSEKDKQGVSFAEADCYD